VSRQILSGITVLVLFLWYPLPAADLFLGAGGRAGATLSPDQVHVGIHLDMGEIHERLRFQPNVEIGFGSDLTLVAINPEVLYLFNPRGRWTPYAGGGLGLNVFKYDKGKLLVNETEFEVGLNLLAGFETKVTEMSRIFVEGKFGVGDSPDVKISCGFTFLR